MTEKIHLYYDEEGDYFELHLGEYTESYFEEDEEGILRCVDEKTGRVTGVAILGFKEKMKESNELDIDLLLKKKTTE